MKSYNNESEEAVAQASTSLSEKTTLNGDSHATGIEEAALNGDLHAIDTEKAALNGDSYATGIEETVVDNSVFSGEVIDIPEEEYTDEAPGDRKYMPPSRGTVLTAIAFWGVILLGAILRFWGLGDRPLHHDESMHAYFSLQLMHQMENWAACLNPLNGCYRYNPLLHGPFQFHIIALVYKICELLGVPDSGANNYTARIAAATFGTIMVGMPYFLRDRLGKVGAWLACFLIAVSPSLVYYARFTREDIYMASFTLLLVVGVARYLRTRKMRWLLIAAAGFTLSYATKEATFLTIAIFGSFMGGLLAWEFGTRWSIRSDVTPGAPLGRYFPRTGAPIVLGIYLLVLAFLAKLFFGLLKNLSIYVTNNTAISDQFVAKLESWTIAVLPVIGLIVVAISFTFLLREMQGKLPPPGRHGLARYVDPVDQPLLDTIVTTPWIYWLSALVLAVAIFLVLFTVLFTNIAGGIGDGIWQGLYYWVQQQQVARGGQPWYYYLLLIPLYEQIGLIFGLVGIVRSLLRPTRFRLFLVYWFVGNFCIYSWAGEKMPWLTIHITMPMMLLAALGLEPIVMTLVSLVRNWRRYPSPVELGPQVEGQIALPTSMQPRARVGALAGGGAIFGAVMAIALLLPTLQNMYQLSFVHAADAPHEMMIYVQTSVEVNTVMAKIEQVDRQFYGGRRAVPIGVTQDVIWPWAWYLRDYTDVCFNFPQGCPATARDVQIFIDGQDTIQDDLSTYSQVYAFHQYPMRVQWDQGYMMPPCVPTTANPCTEVQQYVGVGPLLWLSYGDNPPPGAKFNLGRAVNNIWQWWWQRKAIGATDGAYYMGVFIRRSIGVAP